MPGSIGRLNILGDAGRGDAAASTAENLFGVDKPGVNVGPITKEGA
jgi:hypothetical protein